MLIQNLHINILVPKPTHVEKGLVSLGRFPIYVYYVSDYIPYRMHSNSGGRLLFLMAKWKVLKYLPSSNQRQDLGG